MGIGFFELVVVVLVAVLALKPEQLAQAYKSLRRMLLKLRQYTSRLEQDLIAEDKLLQLEQRIKAASLKSDVSDLLPKVNDGSEQQR